MRDRWIRRTLYGLSLSSALLIACEDSAPSRSSATTSGEITSGEMTSGEIASGRAGETINLAGESASDSGVTSSQGRDAWLDRDGGMVQGTGDSVTVTDTDGTSFSCQPISCREKILECGDCVDNDGDGLTDWRDPECLGPCDNTEGAGLSSGVGGETRQTCSLDCYFDFGNGAGNDRCNWDHRCDPLTPEPECAYEPDRLESRDCPIPQDSRCEDLCLELTPNGCDCFGCCTFPELAQAGPNGDRGFVWIGHLDADNVSTCTLDTLSDEASCPRCTPVANCLNECGRCELCVGKTELPDDCFDPPAQSGGEEMGGGQPPSENLRCPEGVQACGHQRDDPCAEGYYCVTGCCKLSIQRF